MLIKGTPGTVNPNNDVIDGWVKGLVPFNNADTLSPKPLIASVKGLFNFNYLSLL